MRIHHLAIGVKNLDKSIKFYQQCFGFTEVERFTKSGWDGKVVILRLGEVNLELFHFNEQIESKDNHNQFNVIGLKHIAFLVDSVDETYSRLKKLNVDIDKPQLGTTCAKFCFLRDPNGVVIELYERRK